MIFRTLEDGRYSAADPEYGIEFHVDRLHLKGHELVGELTIAAGMLSGRAIDGPLLAGSFNFSYPRVRDEWARRLAHRARTGTKLDWYSRLEELCGLVHQAERNGAGPAVNLRDVPPRPHEQELTVLGLTFPRAHPTIVFGDGGTAKSLLALRIASELNLDHGLRIGFFDWELDQYVHRDRLARLNGPTLPDIVYVRCDRPLVQDVDRLKRIVKAERIEYGFLDSIGYGTAGAPEAAEAALDFMRSLRRLGIGTWLIAHVTKAENGDQRPFGSTFWHNSARSTWNIKLASTSPDGHTLSLGLFHRKSNLGRLQSPRGLTVEFAGDQIHVLQTDVTEIEELAGDLPLWQRIASSVKHQPLTLARLAEDLDAKVETIDRTVRRKRELFAKITGLDGVQRIALVERRAS